MDDVVQKMLKKLCIGLGLTEKGKQTRAFPSEHVCWPAATACRFWRGRQSPGRGSDAGQQRQEGSQKKNDVAPLPSWPGLSRSRSARASKRIGALAFWGGPDCRSRNGPVQPLHVAPASRGQLAQRRPARAPPEITDPSTGTRRSRRVRARRAAHAHAARRRPETLEPFSPLLGIAPRRSAQQSSPSPTRRTESFCRTGSRGPVTGGGSRRVAGFLPVFVGEQEEVVSSGAEVYYSALWRTNKSYRRPYSIRFGSVLVVCMLCTIRSLLRARLPHGSEKGTGGFAGDGFRFAGSGFDVSRRAGGGAEAAAALAGGFPGTNKCAIWILEYAPHHQHQELIMQSSSIFFLKFISLAISDHGMCDD